MNASEYHEQAMTTPNQQLRRATVEDVRKLTALWQQENLPWQELEKRFKEFQVVEGEGGELWGAIGFQLMGLEAVIHSEAFLSPEYSEWVRERLWERVQVLARNHGLVRVWTQLKAPFWTGNGFKLADEETLAKLPSALSRASEPWLFLQLREEAPLLSIDKEFALFKEAEREQTERMLRQAKALKMVAAGFAVVVFLLVIVWALYFFRVQRKLSGKQARADMPVPAMTGARQITGAVST